MKRVIEPGAVLGVLGGGQLGRMFALAARRMGYRVHVLVPGEDTPTGQVADREVEADYEDLDAVAEFARRVDVVTFEFENVPAETADAAARHAPVRPAGAVLHTTQNRLREKTFLEKAGLPVPRFRAVRNLEELEAAIAEIGAPAVLKTAAWGYDGKGQRVIRDAAEAAGAWVELGGREAILESFIAFERELSVVAARGQDGAFVAYGPIENRHERHILDLSFDPAEVSETVREQAIEIARTIVEALEVVGVLCVELFLEPGGVLKVNELAPRPHNSGHLTVDAYTTCQFEQQVRAICGLPLGEARRLSPAVMANLLGEIWEAGPPCFERALVVPDVKLHLYGKTEARAGRKMGHLTALAETVAEAERRAVLARGALRADILEVNEEKR